MRSDRRPRAENGSRMHGEAALCSRVHGFCGLAIGGAIAQSLDS